MTRASRERNLIRKHELATSVSLHVQRPSIFPSKSVVVSFASSALADVFEKNEKKNKTTSVYRLI